ncbi:MAG: hypothetical protein IPJ65_16135 [Archangiaceae bacterium]|nr:hypothetical protein [Archangiaceae bacterium]
MTDPLLEQLARTARARAARARADALFERLSAGTLDPELLRELELQAEYDPEVKLKLELYRPLGSAGVERVLASPEAAALRSPGRAPVARRRWAGRVVVGAAAVVSLAASLVLLLPTAGPGLPAYQVTLTGEQQVRGASVPDPVPRLSDGSTFTLIATPATEVAAPVAVHPFLVHEGTVLSWAPPLEVSAAGAVKVEGPVEQLLPSPPGRYLAVLVLGPARAPSPQQVLGWLSGPGAPGSVVVLRVPFERVAP